MLTSYQHYAYLSLTKTSVNPQSASIQDLGEQFKVQSRHIALDACFAHQFGTGIADADSIYLPRVALHCFLERATGTGQKHSKQPVEPQLPTGACVEMSFSALEIQEYLQSYTRKQEWNISEEHLGEDPWTFARELSKDELLQFTKRTPETERIAWTRGTVSIRVSTVTLGEGFTRTVIRASYRGYGENADKFAAQKKYWKLESNGALEESLASALRTHFESAARSAGST